MGARIAAIEAPTIRPKTIWNSMRDDARLAQARLATSTIAPDSTTGRAPMRSDSAPPAMLVNAIAIKPSVIALDMPVTDHPVSFAIDPINTGSENIEPIATQPINAPAATITHR